VKTAEFTGTVKGVPVGSGAENRREKMFPATAAKKEEWRAIKVNMRLADYDRIRQYCREKGQGVSPFMRYAAVLHLDIIEDEAQQKTWGGRSR